MIQMHGTKSTTNPSASSSCVKDDVTKNQPQQSTSAVDSHMFALPIFFSSIIFLTRLAILAKSLQKNKKTVTIIIGIAISQNLE